MLKRRHDNLQRFEHATGSQKIDSPVRFPLKLNMREYTSNAIADSSSCVSRSLCALLRLDR